MTDWPKKHSWWLDAARLRVGLLKRPQPKVPHMTFPKWAAEINELNTFAAWLLWFDGGRKPPRPKVWKRVPAYAWKVWGEYQVAHPKPPKPGPPSPVNNPPSRWKNAPWTRGKYVAISHGLRHNDGVWTVDQLIQRLLSSGCKSVSPQIGDDNPDPDWAENARRLYKAAKAAGLSCWGWGRGDYIDWPRLHNSILSVMPMDGFAVDIEGRCQDDKLPQHLFETFGDEMPLAVVATGGIDDSFGTGAIDSAIRWGDHFDFIGQDYKKIPDLPMTPSTGENFVYWRGTEKNAGKGYRHLPDAKGRWHIPQGMSNAETCPSMEAQRADWTAWSPFIGWWDGEIMEANNEWGVFASL
jgi:hypothetical protein